MPLTQMACAVLNTTDGFKKIALLQNFATQFIAQHHAY